jgi:arylsulfatase A-like enzyme
MSTEKDNVTRRSFIKKSAVAAAAVGGVGLLGAGAYKFLNPSHSFDATVAGLDSTHMPTDLDIINPHAPRPNIVFIYADDLGYGDLSCFGSKAIVTPNLDRMAQDGVRFTDFYSCNALCSPARFGLLTGRYPQRRGLDWPLWGENEASREKAIRRFGQVLGRFGLTDLSRDSKIPGIPVDELTLAEALKPAGYHSGLIGKWHLGDFSALPVYHPLRHGFEYFFGVPCANGQNPFPLYRNEECLEENIQDQAKLTGLYTQEAINFIEKSKDKPFFCYMPHTFPHRPLHASAGFKGKSKAGIYGDAVEELDWSVGQVMECLRANNLENNTLVVFTSDNGPWYNGSANGLRGGKGQSFEGGFRVPMLAQWPGRIPGGTICGELATILDFFPTCLPLAGLGMPQDRIIDGRDIFGLLSGEETSSPNEALYFYHHDELEAVRVGKWKYYRAISLYKYPTPVNKKMGRRGASGRLGEWPLLYNLETDPGESYNLAGNHPEIVEKMEALMKGWEREMQRNPEGWIG